MGRYLTPILKSYVTNYSLHDSKIESAFYFGEKKQNSSARFIE